MRSVFILATVLALSWQASVGFGQSSFTTPVVADVVKLSRAKVDEGTIVAFVQSSTGVNLSASEIINLRSEGISDRVVVALLNQRQSVAAAQAPSYAPAQYAQAQAPVAYAQAAPSVSYVPTTVYADYGDYSYYGGYPYYGGSGYYPGLSFGIGLGCGYWALGMEATVITVTAAGIIQGMVTGGVDTAATVMGGVATPVMAEAIPAAIVEVLMPPAVDSRDTAEEAVFRVDAEEVAFLVVVVGAEAGGIVRELVQEFRFQSQNHPRPRSMGV